MYLFAEGQGQYHSYLVRLWQVDLRSEQVNAPGWRGEVVHIQTGQTWTIADVAPLLLLLSELTDQGQDALD